MSGLPAKPGARWVTYPCCGHCGCMWICGSHEGPCRVAGCIGQQEEVA